MTEVNVFTTYQPHSAEFFKDHLYIADANTGMLIFNLTDRKNPGLVGSFYILRSNISGSLQGWGGMAVAVSGNYAFLSGQKGKGFYMIDVSNPSKPRDLFHSVGKNVYDISVSDIGVRIYNILVRVIKHSYTYIKVGREGNKHCVWDPFP